MIERTFTPPGKGPWELEATHFPRPVTRFMQAVYPDGFVRGFSEGTAKYGLLLDHLDPGFSGEFMYTRPVPYGAPPGAMKPPPKPVLMALTRLHPGMRRRIAAGVRAIETKRWRDDLREWDEVDKPAVIEQHLAIQGVAVTALSNAELADHLDWCAEHVGHSAYLHHKYTVAAVFTVGDFLAGAVDWTGLGAGNLLGLLRGSSPISRGFAVIELEHAAKAITRSDSARALLGGTPGRTTLEALCADPEAGAGVSAYVEAVRWRSVGYDVGDETAGELPEMLVGSLRAAVDGVTNRPDDADRLGAIRERVPAEHRSDFDERLGEVRLMYRLRDERGAYSDGWATGLARRALLEAGRRLSREGRISDPQLAVDLSPTEVTGLLRGEPGPDEAELLLRREWRTTRTIRDAPPFLGAAPSPAPPVEWLPARARRSARAVNTVMENVFNVVDRANTATVLHGLSVNDGVYEGTARLIDSSADFGRIERGDVLVTKMTSPYFNVVLPLLGAIVTDRGGQLCHAAIVAREYGIPGVVGTREATAKIPDGARVRVDGTSGEVHVLG